MRAYKPIFPKVKKDWEPAKSTESKRFRGDLISVRDEATEAGKRNARCHHQIRNALAKTLTASRGTRRRLRPADQCLHGNEDEAGGLECEVAKELPRSRSYRPGTPFNDNQRPSRLRDGLMRSGRGTKTKKVFEKMKKALDLADFRTDLDLRLEREVGADTDDTKDHVPPELPVATLMLIGANGAEIKDLNEAEAGIPKLAEERSRTNVLLAWLLLTQWLYFGGKAADRPFGRTCLTKPMPARSAGRFLQLPASCVVQSSSKRKSVA